MFGLYMAIIFLLAWTKFSPVLNVVKAILITLIVKLIRNRKEAEE